MKEYFTFAFLTLALSACALVPNSVRPEFEHLSHVTQHFQSNSNPDYGANMMNLVAHWDVKRAYVEVAEGADLNHHYASSNSFGEIQGPREEFSARIGYVFQVKP